MEPLREGSQNPPTLEPKWYHRKSIVILGLMFFFPLGLYLLWTSPVTRTSGRIVWTAIVGVGLLVYTGSGDSGTPGSAPVAQSTQSSASQSAASQPASSQPPASQPAASQPTISQPTTSEPTAAQSATSQTTTAPPAASQPTSSQPGPTSTRSLTPAQRNAVRNANSYLQMSGFSRQGLIDQLSSEYGDRFSVEDATVAVDSLDVDWNSQAARSAASYLKLSGFSCQGLIDQLSSSYGDKYTVSQATYGATRAGIC